MDFVVRRDDLHRCQAVEPADVELAPGQALLEVSAFGLSSNNVTYGVFGDMMSYWNFFPAAPGWGRIPMWGFADVVDSSVDGVETGTRVYGYVPPSTHLVVTPARAGAAGFVDASPHRAALPAAYNRYANVAVDPAYDAATEDLQMLLRPLFYTAFLIDDFFEENDLFGARSAVLSSASSKTALSTAFLLKQREGVEVVGLTSPQRAGFVEGLGVYDRVVSYPEVGAAPVAGTVYVDMSGDTAVRSAVHQRFGDSLAHSCAVGATHWDRMAPTADPLPGPPPTLFFAPDRVAKRAGDWGPEVLEARLADAWRPFVDWTRGWLNVVHGRGPKAVEAAYLEVLDGRSDPATGHVLSMAP